jgi:hypothetical protein
MPVITGVQGYTSLTQQTRLCIETGSAPGESLLMALTTGASTMSLTTQPNTISATTGMHLHFYVFGNATAGTIGIVGTNGTGGAQTSITYHVNAAPQQAQGYTEFTTKEAWGTVTASSITLTSLTPCQVMVFGSFAGKYLLPISLDKEEKITHHAPQDKRGILFKNMRVVQLTKAVDVGKLDSDLYPDSLWAYYMAIGNTPVTTTAPATPSVLLASTAIAASMTLTTGPVAPGEFLIFTITGNTLAGTIVVGGTDQYGMAYASTETITFTSAASQTVYSTRRYSVVNNGGANKIVTTGGTSSSIAVSGVYAWIYTWTFDGINNVTPYSAAIEAYDGVQGVVIPGYVMSDATFAWAKEKEITLATKGSAQDFLIVGDPTSTTVGTNPFATIAQPTSLPYVSWPASFYIDAGTGTPSTTQDGTMLDYKLMLTTGRKWMYAGDGFQRPTYVTWDAEPDWSLDATIIYPNYQNYINYFKTNAALILAANFQGNWLGMISTTNYYEGVAITLPARVDSFKVDQTKSPVSGTLKLMSCYDFSNLGFAYRIACTTQQPPVYTN